MSDPEVISKQISNAGRQLHIVHLPGEVSNDLFPEGSDSRITAAGRGAINFASEEVFLSRNRGCTPPPARSEVYDIGVAQGTIEHAQAICAQGAGRLTVGAYN